MAGALYIWIMLAFAVGCGGVLLLLVGLLLIGHWFDRRAGARHRFLELPEELRKGETETQGDSADPPREGGQR